MKKYLLCLLCIVTVKLYSQNVGVGTSSPRAVFHVKKGNSGVGVNGNPPAMVIEDSGTTLLQITGHSNSLFDRMGIQFTDFNQSNFISFYGPSQTLKMGSNAYQFMLSRFGAVIHDQNTEQGQDFSAVLELNSNTKGLLLPRLSFTERQVISNPATSLLLYQTNNDSGLYYNAGKPATADWKKLVTTTDLSPFIRSENGRVGINTTSPLGTLHIRNNDALEPQLVFESALDQFHRATIRFDQQRLIFQNKVGGSSFWDFNSDDSVTQISLNTQGEIRMNGGLAMNSKNSGILIPRLTLTERDNMFDNQTGMLIYQTNNDSGFYYNAGNQFSRSWNRLITTNDLKPLTLKKEGRVGINTINPSGALHITNIEQGDHIVLEDVVSHSAATINYSLNHTIFNMAGNSDWQFRASNLFTAMRLTTDGDAFIKRSVLIADPINSKVGVGTNNPAAPIHVVRNNGSGGPSNVRSIMILESNDHAYLQFSNPNDRETGLLSGNESTSTRSALIFTPDSSVVIRAGGNNTKVTVNKLGNVGIGTTTPGAKLEVNGSVKLGSNGTVLTNIIKATVNKNLTSIAANNTSVQGFAVPDAPLNSTVTISPSTSFPSGILIGWARVSSTGVVQVNFYNTTSTAIDAAAMDFYLTVVQ